MHGPRARFVQLATVRELGEELLARAGETETLRAQHAAHYLALAERAASVLRSAARDSRLDQLEADLDHLRAALRWYLAAPDRAARGLALAGALHWFWYFRGHLAEGRQWLERALDAVTPPPRPPPRPGRSWP